ncbi:Uma2 family endonuclease [Cronbergia sp. UHCC 0137]|uniref:Uma2 family endonuclease n=1 Tax=Cronbergia sp. UHCC 0137 TaxID=3110239 RepID=UPI002B202662|nr:Uma2 family endonuclease [Cronbergia sp. UHCC 0137]MEA5619499.1 Uma2 family endonuclease [Cronbergia sp. UHCC 0137]
MQLLNQIADTTDNRILLYGVTWEQYETLVNLFIDQFPGLRMIYLEGTLEIMGTSSEHERLKTIIARLIEIFALEKQINLNGYGNTTFRKQAKERGLEADECYYLGEFSEFPDIALEIALTSGGVDKLKVYEGLGVSEVWFWKNNQFLIYHFTDGKYQQIERSQLLPDLDFYLLSQFIDYSNQTQAVIGYQKALREGQ